MDEFLELNTALQYPNKVVELMTKEGVSEGIVLQFLSNIKHSSVRKRSLKIQEDVSMRFH
jgi:hypothetical protein